jgi:threonine/homoserine/homoserine lactone efflux protein
MATRLLGAGSIWRAIRDRDHDDPGTATMGRRLGSRSALRQGALSNLGNPKMAIFFSSLLPQFAAAGPGAARRCSVSGSSSRR